MLRKRKFFTVFAILISFVLLFTACESSGGVNLNQVMKSAIVEESLEGKSSIKLEVVAGEGSTWLEESGLGMLAAFPLEIDFFDLKQESLSTSSSKGNLHIAGMTIPFAMSATIDELVFEVDGIERPLVMSNLSYDELGLGVDYDVEQLEEISIGLAAAFYDYLIPNLPNPETLDISSTTITVNGQSQSVRQIHAEISGAEILSLVEKLISNLIEDEEGLRQALDRLYDLFVPYLIDVLKTIEDEEDPDFFNFFLAYLNNKTLVTEFLYTTISQAYLAASRNLDDVQAAFGPLGNSLQDASYATVDLYINGSLNIVRSDVDIFLAAGSTAEEGGIALSLSSEKWNINQPVEAELLSSENGIDLEGYYLGEEILSAISGESTLGQILSAFGLNEKNLYIWLEHDDVFVEDGTTMMWLFDLVNLLGLEVDWASLYEGTVKLSDRQTTIELPIDQNIIIINGVSQEISQGAVETEHDGIYVPVRAVAEAFGYEVSWDSVFNTIDLKKVYF